MLSRHGGHQVAQNSTTYTLPLSNCSNSLPLTHFSSDSGGALSPTLSDLEGSVCLGGCLAGGFLASCAIAPAAATSIAAVTAVNRFNMWGSPGFRSPSNRPPPRGERSSGWVET